MELTLTESFIFGAILSLFTSTLLVIGLFLLIKKKL